MIGRWTSSAGAFGFAESAKKVLQFLMPYLAFGVYLLVNAIAKDDLQPFYVYALVICSFNHCPTCLVKVIQLGN
jgi:FHS family L-fucose permease-like MFS transporter